MNTPDTHAKGKTEKRTAVVTSKNGKTSRVAVETRKKASKPAAAPRRAAPARKEAATEPRGSKGDAILALLRRPEGATNTQMMAASGWQTHSVRGFLAGAVKKRMGLALAATMEGDPPVRVYRIPAPEAV